MSATAPQGYGQTTTTMNRPLYQKGDFGQEVVLVQQYLAAVGFSPGAIDGKYGDKTVAAVAAFQQKMGLNPDGVVWLDTFNALANAWTQSSSGRPQAVSARPQDFIGPEYRPEELGPAPIPKWIIYVGLAGAGAVALYYLTKGRERQPSMAGYTEDEGRCSCGPHYVKSRRLAR